MIIWALILCEAFVNFQGEAKCRWKVLRQFPTQTECAMARVTSPDPNVRDFAQCKLVQ